MEGMLCRCRPAIQRSGLGRDRPGCPAVARPRVGCRDSNANKVDRAKPSKSQARLLSRWTWQANSSRHQVTGFPKLKMHLASWLNDECADAYLSSAPPAH